MPQRSVPGTDQRTSVPCAAVGPPRPVREANRRASVLKEGMEAELLPGALPFENAVKRIVNDAESSRP